MALGNNAFVFINGQKYYIKKDTFDDKHELIAERLAILANINCAHYIYQKKNGVGYYLSKDLSNNGDFFPADVLGLSRQSYSLYSVWNFFEKKYPKDCQKLMNEFIRIYIFNFFIMNSDLHSGNWGVLKDRNGNNSLYIIDNELSFNTEYGIYITSDIFERKGEEEYDNYGFSLIENLKELDKFIKVSDKNSISALLELFERLTPENFNLILEFINQLYGLTGEQMDDLIKLYQRNYDGIFRLLKSHNLVDDMVLK